MSYSERGRRLWNCDETGICTAVASRKILARRGEKNVHETGGGSGRENITILACGSAIGEKLPPYIVYKGKNLMIAHTQGGPRDTRYSMSDSGWMEGANFVEWFRNVFLPAVEDIRHTGPVVLFLDGHQSHTTLGLVEEARDKGIVRYTFPPHTTHLLQPLDVGVFGPLKHVWSQILKEFKLETLAAKVDKRAFPSLVAKMWPRVLLLEHLIGGFRGAGLHPLSRDAIPTSKLKVSIPFQAPPQTQSAQSQQSQSQQSQSQQSQSQQSQSQQSQSQRSQSPQPSALHLQQQPPTPVSIHIAQFFGNLFISQGTVAVSGVPKGRTKPTHYGEALTEEEVVERIRQQEEEKKAKKDSSRRKARGRGQGTGRQARGSQARGRQERGRQTGGKCGEDEDENICQVCGGNYDDDDEEAQEGWIGCDERGCWRWYHYWCVGHLDMPDPKLRWICPACKDEDEDEEQ